MIKVTSLAQAPKLLATAIALSINGITAASSDVDKLKAINDMMVNFSNYNLTETNLMYEELMNKVLLQTVFQRIQFKDPISKAFFKEGTNPSSAMEIIDTHLLETFDYERDKRYPDKQTKARVLQKIITTLKTKYITNTVFMMGVKAAFVSEIAYGEFMSKQVDLLTESLQVILFEDLAPIIESDVKNIITLPATTYDSYDKIFIGINSITEDMMSIPSKKYNLGFVDAATAQASPDARKQITSREDSIVFMSPETFNLLNGDVKTVKFHNAYFDLTKYGSVIKIPLALGEVIIVDKRAFIGYFRANQITTQAWAGNNTVEYFLHYWYVFGSIPWANGVKIKFTAPTTLPSVVPA